MKFVARVLTGFALLGSSAAPAVTIPLHENNQPVTLGMIPPQVDATAFVNRSLFEVAAYYDFSNCLNYTNTGSGALSAFPGFRFDFATNSSRLAAANFVNQGQVSAATNLFIFATNIISSGDLSTGAGGIIRLYGTNLVDIERTGVRSGPGEEFFYDDITTGNTFFPDPGLSDVYWGEGHNNTLNNANNPMPLVSFNDFFFGSPNFGVPYASSPSHQVRVRGSTFTNTTVVPGQFFVIGTNVLSDNLYDVLVWTNVVNATNRVVQMIFYPTNSADPSFHSEARFAQYFGQIGGRSSAMVEFRTVDYDIVLQRNFTNYVYVIDNAATVTNITLQRNADSRTPTTFRPSTLAVTRGQPIYWNFTNFSGYLPFTNDLVINPDYRSNNVPVMYAGYGAQVGDASTAGGFGFNFSFFPAATMEPTNMPGRVEIIGDTVSLGQTRVRAESVFSVKTKNLTSNLVSMVDAPFLIYDLRSIEPTLVITNLAPPTVRRLSGQVNAWSGVWTNWLDSVVVTGTSTNTNTVRIAFHALVVENQLTTVRPVVLHELALHATNVVIGDNLSIGRSVFLEATNLHVQGALQFPPFYNWGHTNVPGLVNLTNDGLIRLTGAGLFGAAPGVPYSNFVNRGTIEGATHVIRTEYFENYGSPTLANSGSLTANSGLLSLHTRTGYQTNSLLSANGDIQLFAECLTNQNTRFQAGGSNSPGALIAAVTNSFCDLFTNANNHWTASAGFQFLQKPQIGDLKGTTLETLIQRLSGRADHLWPAADYGTNNRGYVNNLALSRLVLDGSPGSLFYFAGVTNGPGATNAFYVDYLELRNNATNYTTALFIQTNLIIYFANANLPAEKLNSPARRLVWVPSFAGPLSSTNITYPSGLTYAFNVALAQSKDIDSDGDGFANANDPTPFLVDEIGLTIGWTGGTPELSWNALLNATNTLEYTTDLAAPAWTILTNFPSGATTTRVLVADPGAPLGNRFYRVRIE